MLISELSYITNSFSFYKNYGLANSVDFLQLTSGCENILSGINKLQR